MSTTPLSHLRTAFLRTLAVFPPAWVFCNYGYSIASISGRSMQPTLNPDTNHLRRDLVLLDKLSLSHKPPTRGSIVLLTLPTNPDLTMVKRITALEGDIVRPHYRDGTLAPNTLIRIPKGHCWVEADEPYHGMDSNSFGPVPLGLVRARVTYVLWPFERFGRLVERKAKPGTVVERGQFTEVEVVGSEDEAANGKQSVVKIFK